jgi:hypothetical protein
LRHSDNKRDIRIGTWILRKEYGYSDRNKAFRYEKPDETKDSLILTRIFIYCSNKEIQIWNRKTQNGTGIFRHKQGHSNRNSEHSDGSFNVKNVKTAKS